MKFPVMLVTEFQDGKTTHECLNTPEEFQMSLQNAQSLTGACRVIVFEHHQTVTKQTVWAEPPTTH
jgi:hypothetical protein